MNTPQTPTAEPLARLNGSARRVLRHAANLLDEEARVLLESTTLNGRWTPGDADEQHAKRSYDDFRATARKLRRLASPSDPDQRAPK